MLAGISNDGCTFVNEQLGISLIRTDAHALAHLLHRYAILAEHVVHSLDHLDS